MNYPWEWEGKYECPDCGEDFHFMREKGWDDLNEKEENSWGFQVYHDHTEYAAGVWTGALFKRELRKRKPAIVKQAKDQHTEAYKKRIAARRVEKALS